MKTVTAILLTFSFIFSSFPGRHSYTYAAETAPEAVLTSEQIFEEVSGAVVSLQLYQRNSQNYPILLNSCTAVLVAPGVLLTNLGNLASAFDLNGERLADVEIRVLTRLSKQMFSAKLQAVDSAADLALLNFDAGGLPLKILRAAAQTPIAVGSEVYVVAAPSPESEEGSFGMGVVTEKGFLNYDEHGVARQFIQSNAFIPKESSGAAVVNKRGEWVGLSSCSVERSLPDRIGYFVPASVINANLRFLQWRKNKPNVSLGVFFLNAVSTEQLLRRYELPRGLYVGHVRGNSPAYAAGLQAGDLILSINGVPMRTLSDLRLLMMKARAGDIQDIILLRASNRQEISRRVYLSEYITELP